MRLPRMRRGAGWLIALALLSSTPSRPRAGDPTATPPAPGSPRPVRFPRPVEKTLPNGLRVVVVPRGGVPLVSVRLLVRSGAEVDPPGLNGLTRMTALLLTKGTETRSAPQVAEAIDALGANLEADARWDASTLSVSALAAKLAPVLEILADLVRRPAFAAEEIERLRAQMVDEVAIDLAEPQALARAVAARLLYGVGAYGHEVSGLPETLARIDREAVVRLHGACYRPDNAVLVVGGSIEAEEAWAQAERRFGDWARPAEPLRAPPDVVPAGGAGILVVDQPDAGQAAIYLARAALARTDPRYFEALVANAVLGGGYSARLNQEIRVRRGLSYGVYSHLDARRGAGPLVAFGQTKNESAAEMAALLVGELDRLAPDPIPEEELVPRKASLTGSFARSLETNDGLVHRVAILALYGLPFSELDAYLANVEAVTAAQVRKVAAERLDRAGARLVVVGDGRRFLDDLRRRFPEAEVEVIPEAELDLGAPTLRKAAAP